MLELVASEIMLSGSLQTVRLLDVLGCCGKLVDVLMVDGQPTRGLVGAVKYTNCTSGEG